MKGIYNSLKKELAKKSKSSEILQTMTAPVVWDWPIPTTGTTGENSFNFSDRIPSNFTSETYSQSSNSFSRNYASYLNLINASKFPLSSELSTQRDLNNPQPPLPPNGPMPPFWTMVSKVSSTNDLERAYTLSNYPFQWINSVKSSLPNQALTLLSESGNLTSKSFKNISLTGESNGVQFGFKADAWGTIFINVENWYSSAIVTMTQQAKGLFIDGVNRRTVFSPNGLLPGRVGSLIVALNPTATVQVDISKLATEFDIADIGSISVGGFEFGDSSDNGLNIAASFSKKKISDSLIEYSTVPSSTSDIAYIIAVQLEKFY
ncbi:MAG: hypothetical protein ACI9P5_002716 [Saprospiraceae bacterium]|jgi:hypothetical protein